MMYTKQASFMFLLVLVFFACNKNTVDPPLPPGPGPGSDFAYSDSVFYVAGASEDQIIKPVKALDGSYYGFPDGIEIDKNSGAINISKSETGLKYLITYVSNDKKDTLTTFVTISGINYLDGFYKLNTDDSVAQPLYNGNVGTVVPGIGGGSLFDIGSGCNDSGCNVIPVTGKINLAQTVRNGVFGKDPKNNDRREFELVYRLDDKSGKATNKLKVKLYYFNTMADVTPEAMDIISSRQGTILNASSALPSLAAQKKAAKPRPPCIFIVGR